MALFIQNEWRRSRAVLVRKARINEGLMNYMRGMPVSASRHIKFGDLYLPVKLGAFNSRRARILARGREGEWMFVHQREHR